MNRSKAHSVEIRKFILLNVSHHPKDITSVTAEKFGITRQATLRHMKRLASESMLEVHGLTKDREYKLKPLVVYSEPYLINGLEEDKIWREKIRPLFSNISKNIVSICEYGFTEMLNNVIDHSEGTRVGIALNFYFDKIEIQIKDDGVGIFKKIQNKFNLDDQRHSILELAKGKLTTDPEHHTGEGIFFTSRMFDFFSILSNSLFFSHTTDGNDWLIEDDTSGGNEAGTVVTMEINPNSERTTQSIFDTFANADGDYGFSRTQIPVALARYADENLVSRSQAKRLLVRIERFQEVVLDFKGVDTVGQAFADEVFRVFQKQNPQIHFYPINANEQIQQMISRAKSNLIS